MSVNVRSGVLLTYIKEILEKNGFFVGRTMLQKVAYFTYDRVTRNKAFIPFLYGPYSEGLQSLIKRMENNPDIFKKYCNYKRDEKIIKRIQKIVTFLKKNNFHTPSEVSMLAKVHYILENEAYNNPHDIKKLALLLGWKELHEKSDTEIEKLIETVRHMKQDVLN